MREGKAQRLLERVAAPTGGRNVAGQPSRARGQSSGGAVSAAARTSPRAAAQTGDPSSTMRARALRVLEAAEAWPRRRKQGRSRGRWWRGPAARATARPCRIRAVQAGITPTDGRHTHAYNRNNGNDYRRGDAHGAGPLRYPARAA